MKIRTLLREIKQSFLGFHREEALLCITIVSTFAPFFLTAAMALVCMVFLFVRKDLREKMFVTRGFKSMLLLLSLAVLVPVVRGFLIGIGTGLLFIVLMFFVFFARIVMTKKVFETSMDLCLLASVACTLIGLIQFALNHDDPFSVQYRVASVFFNANYYGSMMEMVIMCCIYKISTRPRYKLYYIVIALFGVLGIYLSGSMSAFVALAGGILTVMLIRHRRTGFNVIFACMVFCTIAVVMLPDLFPRIAEFSKTLGLREEIWETTIKGIQDSPWVGHGVLGYMDAYVKYQSFETTHAHNLYLNLILDFGIIGGALFVYYIYRMIAPIFSAIRYHYDRELCTLVIAQLVVVLVHGVTDVTYLWIQTGILMMSILCVPGILAPEETSPDESGSVSSAEQ